MTTAALDERAMIASLIPFDEFAWFVGLFEGEGCISVRRKRDRGVVRKPSLRLIVRMTDEDTVRRVFYLAQCGSVTGPVLRDHQRKPQWSWVAEGAPAERLLTRMVPHLCNRRRARAIEALHATGGHVGEDQLRIKDQA